MLASTPESAAVQVLTPESAAITVTTSEPAMVRAPTSESAPVTAPTSESVAASTQWIQGELYPLIKKNKTKVFFFGKLFKYSYVL